MKPKLFYEHPIGVYRPLTDDETVAIQRHIDKVNKLKNEIALAKTKLKKLTSNCDHRIVYDEDSFIYSIRTCAKCGRQELI